MKKKREEVVLPSKRDILVLRGNLGENLRGRTLSTIKWTTFSSNVSGKINKFTTYIWFVQRPFAYVGELFSSSC